MPKILQEVAYRALPRVEPGRVFAESEWRVLASAAEVMLDGSSVPFGPEEAADNVEAFLIRGRSKRAWRIRILMNLIEYLPIAVTGRRFTSLSFDERKDLILERYVGDHPLLKGGRLWAICAKVRYLILMGGYGDPRTAAPLQFVPANERARLRIINTQRPVEPTPRGGDPQVQAR